MTKRYSRIAPSGLILRGEAFSLALTTQVGAGSPSLVVTAHSHTIAAESGKEVLMDNFNVAGTVSLVAGEFVITEATTQVAAQASSLEVAAHPLKKEDITMANVAETASTVTITHKTEGETLVIEVREEKTKMLTIAQQLHALKKVVTTNYAGEEKIHSKEEQRAARIRRALAEQTKAQRLAEKKAWEARIANLKKVGSTEHKRWVDMTQRNEFQAELEKEGRILMGQAAQLQAVAELRYTPENMLRFEQRLAEAEMLVKKAEIKAIRVAKSKVNAVKAKAKKAKAIAQAELEVSIDFARKLTREAKRLARMGARQLALALGTAKRNKKRKAKVAKLIPFPKGVGAAESGFDTNTNKEVNTAMANKPKSLIARIALAIYNIFETSAQMAAVTVDVDTPVVPEANKPGINPSKLMRMHFAIQETWKKETQAGDGYIACSGGGVYVDSAKGAHMNPWMIAINGNRTAKIEFIPGDASTAFYVAGSATEIMLNANSRKSRDMYEFLYVELTKNSELEKPREFPQLIVAGTTYIPNSKTSAVKPKKLSQGRRKNQWIEVLELKLNKIDSYKIVYKGDPEWLEYVFEHAEEIDAATVVVTGEAAREPKKASDNNYNTLLQLHKDGVIDRDELMAKLNVSRMSDKPIAQPKTVETFASSMDEAVNEKKAGSEDQPSVSADESSEESFDFIKPESASSDNAAKPLI